MQNYLQAALRELASRLKWIKSSRPRNLEAEYDVVSQAIASEIDRLISEIDSVLDELVEGNPCRLKTVFLRHRELVGETKTIELLVSPALAHIGERDIALSKLVRSVCREIQFPLQPPAVTLSSKESFWILRDYHLLAAPFREDHSPLQFPAIYHELGHLLSSEENDSQIQAFKSSALLSVSKVLEHFRNKQVYANRRKNAQIVCSQLKAWSYLWVSHWHEEFVCDAFAAATCGPAYGWALAHSALSAEVDPFEIPGEIRAYPHPADDARMQVVIAVIERAGWKTESESLATFWQKSAVMTGKEKEVEFEQCYPDDLLKNLASTILDAVREIECIVAVPSSDSPSAKKLLCWWDDAIDGRDTPSDWVDELLS